MQNLISKLRKTKLTPKIYLEFPENPGIYIYFKDKTPIYVGKAINLKRRVASYFRLSLEPKTEKMMSEAEKISYIKVDNELEALLLEAKLIRTYQPKYNIISKDDKHPLYIGITKEEYPRIIALRKTDFQTHPKIDVFGPFPSSGNVRSVLKLIRGIFPYSDHKLGKKPCLYSQIGLCSPCPSEIEGIKDIGLKSKKQNQYRKNIRHIRSLLNGNIKTLKNDLTKEMKKSASQQNFEDAMVIRNRIQRIEYITNPKISIDSYMENPNLYEDIRAKELRSLIKYLKSFGLNIEKLSRIECFDVAHLQGVSASASMVTFLDGSPDKNFYRHFRIRQKKGQDDYQSMREVSQRRKNHLEDWGRPDLIIVDGGKGQLSVFLKEFEEENIPVVGLAKRFEKLVIPSKIYETTEIKEFRLPKGPALNLVQRIRDEAHRFAQAYHHKLFARSLFEKGK